MCIKMPVFVLMKLYALHILSNRIPHRSRDHTLPLFWLQVLLSLLSVKVPITDADLIRALACKALVGLSRSSAIRQIISKLPLFASGHIQQVRKRPSIKKILWFKNLKDSIFNTKILNNSQLDYTILDFFCLLNLLVYSMLQTSTDFSPMTKNKLLKTFLILFCGNLKESCDFF